MDNMAQIGQLQARYMAEKSRLSVPQEVELDARRVRYAVTRFKTFLKSLDGSFSATLLGLPAELLNQILDETLPKGETITVCNVYAAHGKPEVWPAVAQASRELRKSSLSMYLANNTFVANVSGAQSTEFQGWLYVFRGLHKDQKAALSRLTIICDGRFAKLQYRVVCPAHPTSIPAWLPDFPHWNNVVYAVKRAGLQAPQLHWTTTPSTDIRHGVHALGFDSQTWLLQGAYLFGKHILPTLLRIHGLYDTSNPPIDVVTQLLKLPATRVPPPKGKIIELVTNAVQKCRKEPELWFSEWARRKEVRGASDQSLEREAAHLLREHRQARSKGVEGGLPGILCEQGKSMPESESDPTCEQCLCREAQVKREFENDTMPPA